MERRLVDSLTALVDSGVILTRDERIFRMVDHFELDSKRQDISYLRTGVVDDLKIFHQLAARYKLPTHNPVAFFTEALKIEPTLPPKKLHDFKILLGLAISGRGFVFGSAFDWDRNLNMRPCDVGALDKFSELPPHPCLAIYYPALVNHALLSGACYFRQECMDTYSLMEKLDQQNELVRSWQEQPRNVTELGQETFYPTIWDILLFWNIYKEYCMSQIEYSVDVRYSTADVESDKITQVTVASESEIQKVKTDLDDLEQTMKLLIHLNYYDKKLRELFKIESDNEYLDKKQSWISNYMRFLNLDRTQTELQAAQRITTLDDSAGPDHPLIPIDFIRAASVGVLSNDTKERYPILDRQSKKRSLNKAERGAITGYKKHPMYRCFKNICEELQKAHIARIAPYYIAHFFIHKRSPKNPFLKKSYTFTDKHAEINSHLTVTNDERLIYSQDCNYSFYNNLCQYMEERHPELMDHGTALSDALYARCCNLVVREDWLKIGSRPIYKRWMADNLTYELYQKMDGLFDFAEFPIYAKTFCRAEDMFYFFYEKQDQKIVSVKRAIRKLIDNKVTEEYKEKAFLSEDGIGNSTMPLEWHEGLAEWLEGIIKKDRIVQDYVVGNPDPYYPGSRVRLSEINRVYKAINQITPDEQQDFLKISPPGTTIDTSTDQRILPEDIQPYLSIVEWYIQKICCERIGEDMRPKVFGLCKRIFLSL